MSTRFVDVIDSKWQDLKARAVDLATADARTVDVLWPLFQYEGVDLYQFESANMCLLADNTRRRLLLNNEIVSSISDHIASQTALHWFWTHQLVHVSQGLSYKTFRTLNEDTDRMETMRADVWADFISLKTLALTDLLDSGVPAAAASNAAVQRQIARYHSEFIQSMLTLNPNLFIPFAREIEIKRILSLLVGGILAQRLVAENSDDLLDDSLFVNWRETADELYIWYGQTSLLGRRAVRCDSALLKELVAAIRLQNFDRARNLLSALPLPEPAEYVDQCRRQLPAAAYVNAQALA